MPDQSMMPVVDYTYDASVSRVIDGDTYVLDIDLGFYVATTQHIRLLGANCPEMTTDAGKAARAYVVDLFTKAGNQLVVQTQKIPTRSFERYVAGCWLPDGRDVAGVLIQAGQAVEEIS